jgi:hypothetical protein
MIMKTTTLLFAALCLHCSSACAAPILDCLPAAPLHITVDIQDGSGSGPRTLLMSGGSSPSLSIVDANTGQVVWSAGAAGSVAQRFAAMTAGFSGSITALDTDSDGLHDRIYAGDLSGRIWRFDLHNGAAADHWATGGVFADFSDVTYGRAFVAAPDVSLSAATVTPPRLNIAVGSASLSGLAANNRFYIMRDYAVTGSWTAAQYSRWQPLRESDLTLVDGTTNITPPDAGPGYYFDLGAGQVLTPSITVSGRAVLAVADSSPSQAMHCRVPISVGAVAVDTGKPDFDLNHDGVVDRRDWRVTQSTDVAADDIFTLADAGTDHTTASCTLGDMPIPACDLDTSLLRTYWRREGAD